MKGSINHTKAYQHFRRFVFGYTVMVLLVLALVGVFLWQHSKVNTANKHSSNLTAQISHLNKEVANLSKTVANSKSKGSLAPTYKAGDTQCVKSLCITLDRVFSEPAANSPGGGLTRSDILFSALITVTNSGATPAATDSEAGVTDASMVYTSDNLFVRPYTGNVGAIEGCNTIFGNYIAGYPQTGQTETGCVVFEVLPNVLVDTYLYGDLKWFL